MQPDPSLQPFVDSLFHPSDFCEDSGDALAHALSIALHRRGELTLMDVGASGEARGEWSGVPLVRSVLDRWNLMDGERPRAAVFGENAVRVRLVGRRGGSPLQDALAHLAAQPSDLIVLATGGREWLPRWLQPSDAERLARRSLTRTLFVPRDARGMVSPADGSLELERILVPVDRRPDPIAAIAYAARAAVFSASAGVDIQLLHVGEDSSVLEVEPPELQTCSWHRILRGGNVVDEIVGVAADYATDLIVMATAGHHGVLDALRGTVTEQVVRRATCPVLAVPPV